MILVTFLAQIAGGCYLAVATAAITLCGWRYLRLMAIVSLSLAVLAGLALLRSGAVADRVAYAVIGMGLVAGVVWLFVNASQQERVGGAQRLWPLLAGVAWVVVAMRLAAGGEPLQSAGVAREGVAALCGTALLGGLLLGVVTASMLLGHRYLTEHDLPIRPLAGLTRMYLAVLGARVLWVGVASWPLWTGDFARRGDYAWFWMVICVRVGVGLVGTGIFAWMAWDCVRRRATQSATAIYYLSMLFVFIGELSGQYLARVEGLPL